MQAKQHFDESSRMERSLHGDRDHPDIAAILHALGLVSQQTGDLKQAKQHFDKSLRMERFLHGDRDHPDIAAILHALGLVIQQAGDLKQAKQHIDKSLRMESSLHGDRDHPDLAATLHALGQVSQQAGDLKQAKQHFDESLQMKLSLHGDRNRHFCGMMLCVFWHAFVQRLQARVNNREIGGWWGSSTHTSFSQSRQANVRCVNEMVGAGAQCGCYRVQCRRFGRFVIACYC